MSTIETLRRAAALIRERAEAASPVSPTTGPIPWHTADDLSTADSIFQHGLDETDADHIASWHPAVAFEVAKLLQAQVDYWVDGEGPCEARCAHVDCETTNALLPLARAYLGEEA